MIRDLDNALQLLLQRYAPPGSLLENASISFDLPDAKWRSSLSGLTVNCYLYDIHENRELRTNESLTTRSADGRRAARLSPPVRIDCSYCITAWSTATSDAVLEEHRLLSQVLRTLLQHPTLPEDVLRDSLGTQLPAAPTLIASREGLRNQPEFWHALDQKLKPSLNYVITLAMLLEALPTDTSMTRVVDTVSVEADHLATSN